jgi:hypothetical protein
MTNRERAREIAGELGRNALLYLSRGDRPLTDAELRQTIEVITALLDARLQDGEPTK